MGSRRLLAIAFFAGALAACGGPPDERHPGVDRGEMPSTALTVCAAGPTVKGVDVSHWDGALDWVKLAGSGQAFGIAKATEGVTFVDPMFQANWPAIKAAGLVRGAYHFFRPAYGGAQQAQFFLGKVGSFAEGDLPPVLDWEATDSVPAATNVARVREFVDEVKARTGLTTIVYTSARFLGTVGSPAQFAALPLWDAHWNVACPNIPNSWSTWAFWQTGSSSGTLPGTNGAVDVNLFNGTLAELRAMTGPGETAPPDAGIDAGTPDADAGELDAGDADAGAPDAGDSRDAGPGDAGAGAGDAADAGTPAPPASIVLGCGSAPGAQGFVLALVLILLAARRRRA